MNRPYTAPPGIHPTIDFPPNPGWFKIEMVSSVVSSK